MEIIKGYNYLSISKWFEEKKVEAKGRMGNCSQMGKAD